MCKSARGPDVPIPTLRLSAVITKAGVENTVLPGSAEGIISKPWFTVRPSY